MDHVHREDEVEFCVWNPEGFRPARLEPGGRTLRHGLLEHGA